MIEMGDTLGPHLALLVESGAHRFDPVRFCYIESLARRSLGKREPVCRFIERKALKALDDYQVRFDEARAEAADIVARVSSEYPNSADRIHGLFENCDFKGVRRLAGRLNRDSTQKALVTLTNQITQGASHSEENETYLSFDDILQRREDEVIQSFGNSLAGEESTQSGRKVELRSFHLFKETWAKLYSDKLVTHAIMERPENPGPLNAQMLATRSLSAMRNISPSYLNRFVSYIDTLLWLERAVKDVNPE